MIKKGKKTGFRLGKVERSASYKQVVVDGIVAMESEGLLRLVLATACPSDVEKGEIHSCIETELVITPEVGKTFHRNLGKWLEKQQKKRR